MPTKNVKYTVYAKVKGEIIIRNGRCRDKS